VAKAKTGGIKDAYEIYDDSGKALALYARWAGDYDADTASYGYVGPARAASVLARVGLPRSAAILDVGCGTGLVGSALAAEGFGTIDGTDISPEMIAIARAKGVYRDLSLDDLLVGLGHPTGSYDAIISVGTFGPLGPPALGECLRVTRAGGLLAISVNEIWYEERGFAEAFRVMERDGRIAIVEIATHDHLTESAHKAYVGVLRKL
jgi:predicted TPR repeat methyltransferase